MIRWLRNVVLGDPTCTRCDRTRAACICAILPARAIRQQLPRDRTQTRKGKR